jgi:thiamine-phosphate pyrophosphorylase
MRPARFGEDGEQMRYEPTPALTFALERAAGYARRAGADLIAPMHLLLGLVAEEEGQPASLLAAAGVPREVLRSEFGLIEGAPRDTAEIALAGETRSLLARARELAALHSAEGTLSSDQVLIALVEQQEDVRGRLTGAGLDAAWLLGHLDPKPPLVLDEPLDLRPPAEEVDAARVVDAAANRAREALRVLEDHCRFVVNDALLTGRLKQLRHDLAAALDRLPPGLLLAARDTTHDVGTGISTEQEWQRESLAAVVQANGKRLQEALRSLEEFGKLLHIDFAQAIERLRYESYTLERALVVGQDARDRLAECQLYVLVTEAQCRASLVGTVREACAGGAEVIQLREKTLDDRPLLALARDVRKITRDAGALFVVNDRPDIAVLAEADGVHLGQHDLPVYEARRIVGSAALIGVSTHDMTQLGRAVLEGASYLGVGPTFASRTKEFTQLAGLDFVRQAAAETTLPFFVLGGVTAENVGEVLAAGGRRVAVSAAVCAADDPRRAALALRAALRAAR